MFQCNYRHVSFSSHYCRVASQDKQVTITIRSPIQQRNMFNKYLHLVIADTLGPVIVSSSCRPHSRAGVSLASSPCACLFVLWLGSQESWGGGTLWKKFCSAKPIIAKKKKKNSGQRMALTARGDCRIHS